MRHDDFLDALDELTHAIHAEGRAATRRHSYTEGATIRVVVNTIRRAFGLAPIMYDGDEGVDE